MRTIRIALRRFLGSKREAARPMAAYQDIKVARPEPAIMLITLDRPEVLNALRTSLLAEVVDALAKAEADDAVRCVVVAGGKKAFAAGADISEMAHMDAIGAMVDRRLDSWKVIRAFPKPIIAAVNGYALGGGLELAMHADIMIVGEDAKLGQPEVNLGIIPGAGGTQWLTRAVGKALAMKMCLAGEFIGAREAVERGLAVEVCPPELTVERALAMAGTIAQKAPLAVRLAKESVLKALELPLSEALAAERRAFCLLFATEDRTEGVAAFLEKRKPEFKGR